AYLRMCGLPVQVVCRANAEYMSPSGQYTSCFISSRKHLAFLTFIFSVGKIPFIHVGNQVVSELGPIVQFTKAKVIQPYSQLFHCEEIVKQGVSSPDDCTDIVVFRVTL
ncbi:Metaxin-2, partial [Goodea atripinnis]